MKNNCISIIIPTYNEKNNIVDLVNYLLEQNEGELKEILIMDAEKSTDQIEKIPFPAIVQIAKCDCTSRAAQFIHGASLAKGTVLYFLHADTRPPKNYLQLILGMFEKGYDFGMFKYKFDQDKWYLRFNGWMTQWKAFYTGGGDQGLFIIKEQYHKVGGFDSTKLIMEDYDLFWRLKKAKYAYQILKDNAIVSARKYDKNASFKVNLVNLVVLWWFKFGGNQAKIKAFYNKHIV
ncbi:glycosyl transferase [Putridiphycobacter roseus]|uniref:Glycosyl transferase n=1 Tax=Putridiphycobacter roseus TaxID=2219161 RepID=A0A2W1N2F8_9FLAO|nr:glycosyltransferase [Putridiphycobacter roseus]PZE17720.1 glycosyl transferase [Putridiphycobacter roseus]